METETDEDLSMESFPYSPGIYNAALLIFQFLFFIILMS